MLSLSTARGGFPLPSLRGAEHSTMARKTAGQLDGTRQQVRTQQPRAPAEEGRADMSSIHTRKALSVAAASFASMTLIPLAVEASRTQRVLLVAGALPLAVLFGALAAWTPPCPAQPTSATLGAAATSPVARTASTVSGPATRLQTTPASAPPDGRRASAPPPTTQMVSWAQLPAEVKAALAAGHTAAPAQHTGHVYS
ncbi:hypothetical protein GCM10027586_20210 [Kineococcus gypseus]